MRLAAACVALCLTAGSAHAQLEPGVNLAGQQGVVGYAQGVGRILWSFPKDLDAGLAVPHFSAGARVKCTGSGFECEIQVIGRDISVGEAERRRLLEEDIRPLLAQAVEKKPAIEQRGDWLFYVTLQDARGTEHYRYLTQGFAHKGTAVFRFTFLSVGRPDLAAFFRLIEDARPIDAPVMWALRLGDYRAACEERFPAYKEANDRAFAASPFAAIDLVQAFLKFDPAQPEQKVREGLARARKGFAESFDRDTPERRQAFCEGFPRWVAEAAKGV